MSTILITGGAKGIGRKIALDFAKEGYNVFINYNTSEEKAKELESTLLEDGYNVCIYKADITKRDEVDKMVDYCISKFGGIDVLVNNAGICKYELFTEFKEEDFEKMVNTNLGGTFNITQSVLKKYMLNQKEGSIINISSIWGLVGGSCEVVYSMTKAGIIGMTKALAKELSLSNIRVNAVAPGCINTDMLKDFSIDELEQIKSEIPLNKIGEPEDVSNVVLFLASSKSKYITGQVISPNGGMVI